jgi:hypothetical protein
VTPSLADIAVEAGLVSAADVAEARRRSVASGEPLVVTLIGLTGADESTLARAVGARLGVAEPTSLDVHDSDALREIPHELARRRRILPLSLEHGRDGARVLRVVCADPSDGETLGVIESTAACRVEALVAPLGSIERAIDFAYRQFVTQVMPRAELAGAPVPAPAPGGGARRPFGGDLAVRTPIGSAAEAPPGPVTTPFHRLEDEAPIEVRLEALVDVLETRGLMTRDEWQARIRALLRDPE